MNLSIPHVRVALLAALLSSLVMLSGPAAAAANEAVELSLEDLLKTEVTTVSRKSQTLQSTAAAAFVITREDIERSGATSLPEALRMAPGVQVARLANNRWAVSVRGFNGRYANKLLVLMDGRSIYSPLYSGVLWELEDTLLEDIERIEVIRGPGAALWGANAVNGVINIITRKARDTQGALLIGETGTHERGLVAARYGGESADGHYRIWSKAFAREPSSDASGALGNDYWRAARVGFRRDWTLDSANRFTLSGEAYGGPTGDRWNLADVRSPSGSTPTAVEQASQGARLLGRREWRQEDGSESALQSYVDYVDVNSINAVHQRRLTFDLDYQRRVTLDARHDLLWGANYRFSRDDLVGQGMFSFAPRQRNFLLASAFVQDEFTLLPDALRVIAGARLEYNSFTGLEPQPNLRMVWTPTPNQSVWGALSRAVRTPSRAEQDATVDLLVIPGVPFPTVLRNVPSTSGNLKAEKVDTFELGYRRQIDTRLSVDLTGFYSRYRELRSAQYGAASFVPGAPSYAVQELNTVNGITAHTHGFELAVDWHPLAWWRVQSSYSHLRMAGTATLNDLAMQADAAQLATSAPRNQLSLRSSFSLSQRQQFDVWLRHVSQLGASGLQGQIVPAYTTLDLRYGWRPLPALELSIVGQNLLQPRHAEFVPDLLPSQSMLVERGLYFKAKYQF